MTDLLGVVAILAVLLIPVWLRFFAPRWGEDQVPHAARRYAPDPVWEPWEYLDFPTPADVPPLPAPAAATFHVGTPEQLPSPRRMIGPGR